MYTTTQKSYHTNNYDKSHGHNKPHNHNRQHHSRYQHKHYNKHKQAQIAEVEVCDCEECIHCPDDCTDCDLLAMTLLIPRLQKLVSPSLGFGPEDSRGHQHTVNNSRHTHTNTNPSNDCKHNLDETEIIHIGRKSQNECAVMATIGNRSYKAHWDSGTAKCVLSLDCYQSISPKFKTELHESSIKIRAANGSFIKKQGGSVVISHLSSMV